MRRCDTADVSPLIGRRVHDCSHAKDVGVCCEGSRPNFLARTISALSSHHLPPSLTAAVSSSGAAEHVYPVGTPAPASVPLPILPPGEYAIHVVMRAETAMGSLLPGAGARLAGVLQTALGGLAGDVGVSGLVYDAASSSWAVEFVAVTNASAPRESPSEVVCVSSGPGECEDAGLRSADFAAALASVAVPAGLATELEFAMTLERAPRIMFTQADALVVNLVLEGDVNASTARFVKSLTNISAVEITEEGITAGTFSAPTRLALTLEGVTSNVGADVNWVRPLNPEPKH